MRLISVAVDENYPTVKLSSERGRWELGITPALYGWRVRASPAGDMGCTLDYCCGESIENAILVLSTVGQIFKCLPEEIDAAKVAGFFPEWVKRPIFKDECWPRLLELAVQAAEILSDWREFALAEETL